jgi:membrane protein DedA with SNARE-associated domain
MPRATYVIGSGISCWLWSIAFTYLGFAFGGVAIQVLRFTKRLDVQLGVVALVLLVVLMVLTARRIASNRRGRPGEGEGEGEGDAP